MTFINHKAVCKTRPPKTSRIPKRLTRYINKLFDNRDSNKAVAYQIALFPDSFGFSQVVEINNHRNRRARLFAKP